MHYLTEEPTEGVDAGSAIPARVLLLTLVPAELLFDIVQSPL